MKKIIILNGEGRKNGATAQLVNAFKEGAESAGNEVREFQLQGMNIHDCMNCQGCARMPKGTVRACVQRDDMDAIYDYFAEADVLVMASPVYWFTITGNLKMAVDRLYGPQNNVGHQNMKKETVFLMTSGGPAEMNPNPIQWYHIFGEQMGWPSLGEVLGSGKTAEARALGASIN